MLPPHTPQRRSPERTEGDFPLPGGRPYLPGFTRRKRARACSHSSFGTIANSGTSSAIHSDSGRMMRRRLRRPGTRTHFRLVPDEPPEVALVVEHRADSRVAPPVPVLVASSPVVRSRDPVLSGNSAGRISGGHAAVVAEDATESFVSSNSPAAGPVKRQGNDVAKALVVPLVVIVFHVLADDRLQVLLSERDDVTQALRRVCEPSYFAAISRRYQRRIVSGVARVASSESAARPSASPFSARSVRSASVRRRRPVPRRPRSTGSRPAGTRCPPAAAD